MPSKITSGSWGGYKRAVAKGDPEAARSIAMKAARHYEKIGDFKQEGTWLRALSNALYYQGRFLEAASEAERSIEVQPDPYERSLSFIVLGIGQTLCFRESDGLRALSMAEEIAGTLPRDPYLNASLYAARAMAIRRVGDVDQAIVDGQQATIFYLQAGDLWRAAVLSNNVGFYLAMVNKLNRAEQCLMLALDLIEKQPNVHHKGAIYDSLGYLYTLMDRRCDAERFLKESMRIFEGIGNRPQAIGSLLHLVELHQRTHRIQAARQEALQAVKLAAETDLEPLRLSAANRLFALESYPQQNPYKPKEFHGLVYLSGVMRSLVAKLPVIARSPEIILLLGETGTGKELLAQAIHRESKRRAYPFITFNCSTVSRELIETRLFGHRKGAYTGAEEGNCGVVRAAEGGTLLLDEIGDLNLEAQGALLRFLQSGEIQPVGANKPQKVDVRVIASTNHELRQDVEAGRFRKDLYYRLNITSLWIPPLRLRTDDIMPLARHFARVYSEEYKLPEPVFGEEEMATLIKYDWPGNVRELESYVKRRALFGSRHSRLDGWSDGVLHHKSGDGPRNSTLPRMDLHTGSDPVRSWRRLSDSDKRRVLTEALLANNGCVTAAARQLGISRRTVQKTRGKIRIEKRH